MAIVPAHAREYRVRFGAELARLLVGVPHEHVVVGIEAVVEPHHGGVAIASCGLSVDEVVVQARSVRQRKVCVEQELNGRANTAHWNPVSGELLANDLLRAAVGRSERIEDLAGLLGKVAVALVRNGRGGGNAIAAAAPVAFPVHEEERFFPPMVELRHNHRPPEGEAVLVLTERNLAAALAVGEEVVRIEDIVAEVFVGAAVQIARSGADDHVHIRARRPAVLRRVVRGYAELLQRVHGRREAWRIHHHEVVVDAVHCQVVVLAALAVHRDQRRA